MKIDLGGKWKMSSSGGRSVMVDADVPGDTHSALLAAGVISDPYWARNELEALWVGRADWSFARMFNVDEALLAHKAVYLVCKRIDTVAEIFVNNRLVGTSNNMFVPFKADIKPFLKSGENSIEIKIRSAVNEAARRAKAYGMKIHPSADVLPGREPHGQHLRKVACHSGWDWGICLVVAGIYDSIFLHGVDHARIEYVHTSQTHGYGFCDLTVHTELVSPAAGETGYEVSIGDSKIERSVKLSEGVNKISDTVRIEDPELWWPAGYGAQPLYDLNVRVGGDVFTRKIGIRKLEINYAEDDLGRPLTFRVNGVDIFCKGANWIPADAMPSRQTPERYANLIESAVTANMNMLRVWGGGQYEADVFYELCDMHGVLVWQDFMFACAEYPSCDRAWLASVRREAEHQVKRLRSHACIALWCGDNENLGVLLWSPDLLPSWMRHYERLNHGVLRVVVEELDPDRLFWPSSPCGGPEELINTFLVDLRGDMHFWKVWHQNGAFSDYYKVKPRFCSEFGFQSLPSLETIARFAPEDQWNIGSPVFGHHQRNARGNSIITESITRYFRLPEGFHSFVYLTQVQQALAIKTAVEYWRTTRPLCMGTLYWQLNDNWPVCSWSSLDHGGKWKLLHHAARRFYAPLMATVFCRDQDTLEVFAVNDTVRECPVELRFEVCDFSGNVLKHETISKIIPAGSSVEFKKALVKELTSDCETAFAHITMKSEFGMYENFCFFTEPKNCMLENADISVEVGSDKEGVFAVLSTDKPAFYVAAETFGVKGEFEDNMILLMPDAPRTMRFRTKEKIGPDELKGSVSIRHLRSCY